MTSRAAGAGMLVKGALMSEDTKDSSGATFWSLRDSSNSFVVFDKWELVDKV